MLMRTNCGVEIALADGAPSAGELLRGGHRVSRDP